MFTNAQHQGVGSSYAVGVRRQVKLFRRAHRPITSARISCVQVAILPADGRGIGAMKRRRLHNVLDPNLVSRIRAMNHDERSDTDVSKSNANPNHRKAAGRARRGENNPHAPNTRKHADGLVRRRTRVDEGSQPSPAARGAARTARTAPRKALEAPPLTAPPGQKRGHNLVPGNAAPHARFPKAPRGAALGSAAGPARLKATHATKRTTVPPRGADERGQRSTARTRASVRREVPASATNATGVVGKGPAPRRLPLRK